MLWPFAIWDSFSRHFKVCTNLWLGYGKIRGLTFYFSYRCCRGGFMLFNLLFGELTWQLKSPIFNNWKYIFKTFIIYCHVSLLEGIHFYWTPFTSKILLSFPSRCFGMSLLTPFLRPKTTQEVTSMGVKKHRETHRAFGRLYRDRSFISSLPPSWVPIQWTEIHHELWRYVVKPRTVQGSAKMCLEIWG